MAEYPMSLGPVFLSASVADPRRNEKYFKTGNTIAIRDAVIALVTVVIPRTRLVFGGHPAITPMVKWVADQFGAFDNVRMFQSKFFRDSYLKDLALFRYEETEAVGGAREASLLAMRTRMVESEAFSAAFFIGGMEGVEHEYELMAKLAPNVPRFPVYTSGAAARFLWQKEWEASSDARATELSALRVKTNYVALFTGLLEEIGGG
jgi:hypothetical protein